jgi:6-phosphogluconolactonase (cycloisomerase 2 family)
VKFNRMLGAAGLVLTFVAATAAGSKDADDTVVGAVYTASNAADGNQILMFDRHADGTLTPFRAFATGGTGTGDGLGNQGAVVLTEDGEHLIAVNAASNSLSIFNVEEHGLSLTDVVSSGGIQPISLTVHADTVYVLNAGSDAITGFRISERGRLVALPNSTRTLSGTGVGPAEVAFRPDGRMLIVSEKNTNMIDVFHVSRDGAAGAVMPHASNGTEPFGFAFGKRGELFVSEAFGGAPDASAVSVYRTMRDGALALVDGSERTNQTAACWVLVTRGGRFAYATNTGSGSISGFAIGHNGVLTLLNPDGRTGDTGPGSGPIDLGSSDDGRFLYSLNSSTHMIGAFRIEADGQLAALPFAGGLPVGANGLAVR